MSLRSKACLQELSSDIEKIFVSSRNNDLVLKCQGRFFFVHKNILAARSSVFDSLLQKPDKQQLNISDLKWSVLEQLLHFIYSGRMDTLSMDSAIDLFEAGIRYSVPSLNWLCGKYMAENLSEDNVCRVLYLADLVTDSNLQEAAESFIAEKSHFLKSALWRSFAEENPTLAVKVFDKFVSKQSE